MVLFENPFYILDASPTDDKRRLSVLCDSKSLLCPQKGTDEALWILMHPLKRLAAELRWFPGLSSEDVYDIMCQIQKSAAAAHCSLQDIVIVNNRYNCIAYLNQLITLLPRFPDNIICEALLNAGRQFDSITAKNTMEAVNRTRMVAGFSLINDISVVETALCSYRDEIVAAFDNRIAKLETAEYRILISRIAAFGVSPIFEHVIREYELSVSSKLDSPEAEMLRGTEVLERFFAKELHEEGIAALRSAVSAWCGYIEPLQIYSRTLGSEAVTAAREDRVLKALLGCGDELNKQGSYRYAVELYRCAKMVIAQTERYSDVELAVDKLIKAFDAINAER